MLIGAQVAGWTFNRVVTGNVEQALGRWSTFWWIPAAFAAAVMLGFAALFHDRAVDPIRRTAPAAPPVMAEPGL